MIIVKSRILVNNSNKCMGGGGGDGTQSDIRYSTPLKKSNTCIRYQKKIKYQISKYPPPPPPRSTPPPPHLWFLQIQNMRECGLFVTSYIYCSQNFAVWNRWEGGPGGGGGGGGVHYNIVKMMSVAGVNWHISKNGEKSRQRLSYEKSIW